MGLFGKLFKLSTKRTDDFFTSKFFKKGTEKTVTGNSRKATADIIAKNSQAFTNKGITKTTPAIGNQGVSTATAGGRKILSKIASNTAKGGGTTAKIGGKVIAGTGITAIPILTGIGLYNSYKNSTALTDEDRRVEFLIEMQDKANNLSSGIVDNSTGDPLVDVNPQAIGNTGIGGNSSFNPFKEVYGTDSDSEDKSSGSLLGLIAGVTAVAVGGYYIYKKGKKGKK